MGSIFCSSNKISEQFSSCRTPILTETYNIKAPNFAEYYTQNQSFVTFILHIVY